VATVKSTHHDVDLDPKAKDSARHRAAGAKAVALIGPKRTHLIVEAPLNLAEILALFHGVDLVLVEGLSQADIPKLEVHRPSLQQPLRALNANRLAAIVSDEPVDQSAVPVLNLGDISAIADFIRHQVGL
jgi:molybdopterin-guanine dinucleotide biosynthesis protein B